jgi:hypothetical protein
MAQMEDRHGGNIVRVAVEVRRHSSLLKKLKKYPNKYRTPIQIYHATIYIRETYEK